MSYLKAKFPVQTLRGYEKSACGVGFIASRKQVSDHQILQHALQALACVEHRGACSIDQLSSDGAGVMTDIPFELLGYKKGEVAVAMLFAPQNKEQRRKSLAIFEQVFDYEDLEILAYREVPIQVSVLGKTALATMPYILQAIIKRPAYCRTDASFEKKLYLAKQLTRKKQKQKGIPEIFYASVSTNTIVYKAMSLGKDLANFYLDLQNPAYKTRFALFHRRFSTNTTSTWDKAQPFRIIAHNGEFNTIAGNRSWAVSRENAMGLYEGELLTEKGISDSGSLNEMVEALLHRSSIPYIDEILAILMPTAEDDNPFYKFWGRAMEPWDGPALITFADGINIGARLDRNGFRPCRWAITEDFFYLNSEAGSFQLDESKILQKGTLHAGKGIRMSLLSGRIYFEDPSQNRYNYDAQFDSRTFVLHYLDPKAQGGAHLHKKLLFDYTEEDLNKIIYPMIETAKEPIGSMGDTARLAIFSEEPRSFFDYFYHNFAQVTNPPLDYLREKWVTDLSTYIGKKPNIFAKKDLLPLPVNIELPSPIISLGQMEYLQVLTQKTIQEGRIIAREYDIIFPKELGLVGFKQQIRNIIEQVRKDVSEGVSIIILTDKNASYEKPAMPCLLAMRMVIQELQNAGQRLKFSMIVHSAQIRTTHHVALMIGMGAAAVCPYLALEIARYEPTKETQHLTESQREKNLIKAYEGGLLKIMSKMGISVVRSYQSSQLFTAIGINENLAQKYFERTVCLLGGIDLPEIVENTLKNLQKAQEQEEIKKLLHTYQYKEHNKGLIGEKHSMTNSRSKIIHELVRTSGIGLDKMELYEAYLKAGADDEPVNVRHLFALKNAPKALNMEQVQPMAEILQTFGSGAMSFGAISAEAQRDIILAMKEIGGRSNSGEGGENPYYYTEGITASVKQIASGRFGVNALYLVTGNEIQIKIAQGAKPGEGGQLMAVKVDEHIAKARNSMVGVDLISPPPMHDIYSIEDLKELIYELKQLKPTARVSVKLVSGAGIGTIAVGVAKAGADIIHISGGDGGTGAAPLSSMKGAGLPWEFGLWEVHQALLENGLRHVVTLRTDGGLHTGKDIVMAAILGAEEFEFGKLLLVAQGCVMARICEKNTCPTGIATHDQRFKAKYKGTKDHIVKMMQYLAEDVRRNLAQLGETSLKNIIGRTDLLEINPKHLPLIQKRKINLSYFLQATAPYQPNNQESNPFSEPVNSLNQQLVNDCLPALECKKSVDLSYKIRSTDRAIFATLCGEIAQRQHQAALQKTTFQPDIQLTFYGSAGQGFGVFLTEGVKVKLYGEANDSVCKSMSGGKVVIVPPKEAKFEASKNVIIGNCALYGATGGTLYVCGLAGDRFAVRNSGALAIVEGVGLHACEYMTKGRVIILGETSYNIGGGMTGGEVITFGDKSRFVNTEYLQMVTLQEEELADIQLLLQDYVQQTQSELAQSILQNWHNTKRCFVRYLPISLAKKILEKQNILEKV
ncbi:MAG: glutamate synthase large subunit [Microscillaceae bacterium]|nr:glutamate synthase large subunit [Microscillaceae bacterium]MDW8460963.1 glutamate synthase large subunit [Cytophagales bacterium]